MYTCGRLRSAFVAAFSLLSNTVLCLYSVRITGKEEMVDLYQEEAEVFKEKNYHHKERVLTTAAQKQ